MEKIELRSFSGVTGEPLKRIPFLSCDWSQSINEAGSMKCTISNKYDVETLCAPYRTILALCSGQRIYHAGYVTHINESRSSGEWNVDCGGGLSILKKRLVINYTLAATWADGSVVVDEENPSGYWQLSLRGSYSDIVRGLILESMKFGTLPIQTKPYEGGGHERNYNSYDLATTYDRIHDITQLEDGIEVRFDPIITGDGNLSFRQRSDVEIIDSHWKWNTTLPGSLVTEQDIDIDSEDLCTESYGTGGKDNDSLLVARSRSQTLIDKGYPVLQIANTEHSSVSELPTLQSYVASDVRWGSVEPKSQSFHVNRSLNVQCGDWADIRTSQGVKRMKITDVSGSLSESYLTVQATERY